MISDQIPDGYQLSFEEYLFNTYKHRLTQTPNGWHDLYLLDDKKQLVRASFHFHSNGKIASSPYSATFGGIDFAEDLNLRLLSKFVAGINKEMKAKGLVASHITLAPQNYNNKKFILLFQALKDNGYELQTSMLSAVISIIDLSFEAIIHKSEKKKLKRAYNEGYIFNIENPTSFSSVYQLIDSCRKERGQSLSMSEDQLAAVVKATPDRWHFFSIFDNTRMIASSICIATASDILYVFYGGHLKAYDKSSPAVMLYEGIYKFAQTNGYKLLDFGTSHANDDTDISQLDFKQYIGCNLGLKTTFQIQYQ